MSSAPVASGLTWEEFLDLPDEPRYRHAELADGELRYKFPPLVDGEQVLRRRPCSPPITWSSRTSPPVPG